MDKPGLTEALQKVLQLSFVYLEEREILTKCLTLFKNTALDLEDCYNLCYAKASDVKEFKTFDKKLGKEFANG